MEIKRSDSQQTSKGPAEWFTGLSGLQMSDSAEPITLVPL